MPILVHVPGKRPVVLNDGYDPKTPPKPREGQIEQQKPKPKR